MKQSEHYKRTFQLLAVIFFMIMAVSGGTQWFLSPSRVASWIKEVSPDDENLEIKFKKAQISFSGSLFPLFGVKAKDVMIRYHGCTNSVQLNAPYVLVPFSLIDAFQKKLRLGYIKTGAIDLQILSKDNICIDQNNESVAGAGKGAEPTTKKVTEALQDNDYDKLFTALLRPFRGAKGLKIQRVNLYKPETSLFENPSQDIKDAKAEIEEFVPSKKSKDKKSDTSMAAAISADSAMLKLKETLNQLKAAKQAQVQRLRVTYDRSNESILLSGGIKIQIPGFETFKKLPVYWVNLEFNKEQGLKLNGQARYNEGRFFLSSDYQKKLERFKVQWKASDFPLSFVVRAFGKDRDFSQLNTHLLWLNGEGGLGLRYDDQFHIDVHANLLRLRGELVDAFAQDVSLGVYPKVSVQRPFEWRLEKLDLEQISEFLDHKGLRGVLRRAGHIKGSGIISGFNDILFEGSIEGVEFFFSNSGQKAFQKVKKAELNLEYVQNRLNMDLERIVFGEGEVEGQIHFDLQLDPVHEYKWNFRSTGQSLMFNEQIYTLFALKPFSFDHFDILVEGHQKHADRVNVVAQVKQCETPWGTFDRMGLQILTQQNKKLSVNMRSKKFELDPKYIQTNGLIPGSLVNPSVQMQMDLQSDQGELELTALDGRSPLKIIANEVDYAKKTFAGSLTKAGKTYEIHGDFKTGYRLKIEE